MAEKILVTGASGFLGSHIADELTRRGYDIILFDRVASPYASANQHVTVGDLSDRSCLFSVTEGVDFVFHCAGIADIADCAGSPRDVVLTNILGTVDLLDACCANNVKRFLFAGSAYVFSDLGGFYRSSKKACEDFISDFNKKYGIEYVILRFGSLYGRRSNEKNGMYRLVKQLLSASGDFTYEGTGEEIREFVHIHDAAKLAADAMDERFTNSRLLISGSDKYKMSELIDMIKEIIGKPVLPVRYSDNTLENHYKITPYNYNFEAGVKFVNNPYVDIGQGIIQVIREINDES